MAKLVVNNHNIMINGRLDEHQAILDFLKREKSYNLDTSCIDFSKNVPSRIFDTLSKEIYKDVDRLCHNTRPTLDEVSVAIGKVVSDFNDDPLNEILGTIYMCENHNHCASELYAVLTVNVSFPGDSQTQSSPILAYVSILSDPRILLHNEKAVFFIGIRKSVAFAVAEKIDLNWISVKMTSLLIPAIAELAKTFGAKYIFTYPLYNMNAILTTYYGFSELYSSDEIDLQREEKVQVSYFSPNITLTSPADDDAGCVYKEITIV